MSCDDKTGLVYIIDDDGAVRRSLSSLMTAAGLDHTSYESGIAFLAEYRDRGPACLVMDIRMPGISGLQLLERLRAKGIAHPAIMMTGFGEVDAVIRAFRQGAVDFFEKPISGSLLLDHVQKAIESDVRARVQRDQLMSTRAKLARLTAREREVFGMLIEGLPNKQIAFQLKLSEKTIAAHRANLLAKMDASSLAQVIARVVGCGVELDTAGLAAAAA